MAKDKHERRFDQHMHSMIGNVGWAALLSVLVYFGVERIETATLIGFLLIVAASSLGMALWHFARSETAGTRQEESQQ